MFQNNMLPNASLQTNKSNHNSQSVGQSNNINSGSRRYSLFGGTITTNSSTLSSILSSVSSNKSDSPSSHHAHHDFLNHKESGAGKEAKIGSLKQAISRSTTHEMAYTSNVCQRCRRFEVDLLNTSDNLNATDTELKASRQVISLLQRQLELVQVEKDGIEKLIIAQSDSNPLPIDLMSVGKETIYPDREGKQSIHGQTNHKDIIPQQFEALISLGEADSSDKETTKGNGTCDRQKILLDLIRTQLYSKDEEIVKLKSQLKATQNDKEQLVLQLHHLEEENSKLKSENQVLNENLSLRDQTIVSLSNEVFEQGNPSEYSRTGNNHVNRRQSDISFADHQGSIKAQRHIAKLIDTLDAYKKTNELLSTNVMNLTERCNLAEKKEIENRSQCHELEAKCCQIQSKLLSLLKEIEQSTKLDQHDVGVTEEIGASATKQEAICTESVKLLIKRLLEDKSLDIPLSWKEGNKPSGKKEDAKSSFSKYECDELGFYIVSDENTDSEKSCVSSSSSNTNSKRFSLIETPFHLRTVDECPEELTDTEFNNITSTSQKNIPRQLSVDAAKSDQANWHIRWDNFIKDFDRIDLSKSKDFKILLRSGVPQEYRCKVWKSLVDLRVGSQRRSHSEDYYQGLLEPGRSQNCSKQKSLNPSSKQIELDLLRTLPNNKHFETLDSSGTARLRRVLTAYSEHNPKVGYCQGMNRLAAVALLVLPEEEAFWCLTAIIESIMPTGYYNDLWLAQVDSIVVMDFVAIKLPNLSDHFKKHNIELSLFAWFLTIFVDGTPPALFLRLWDSFLYEGDKILFRVAIALLKMYENQLLKLNNSVAVNNFLRSAVNAPMNIDRFLDIAFEWINPLSSRSLRVKRQSNFQVMRSSFERSYHPAASPVSMNDEDRDQISKNDDCPYDDSSIISV